uniref:Lipase domain-containing protein n=1 Tax=Timema cristinae TaxID=61476 RepID=A0A7R9H8D2_TIMCR|nr:unnamed protein product [Timema cristinae]
MVFHRQGKDSFHFGRSAAIFTQLLILFLASNTAGAVILGPLSTNEVMFQLYTREKPITPHLVNDSVANLNVSKQTVIVIHGFTGSGRAASVTLIRDASLFVQDVNLIVMDWGILAKGPWYEQAVNNTDKAAVALARFIEALFNEGLSPERLTIVGFSLGAQVAGLAAGQLRTATRLKRIVVPPLQDNTIVSERLCPVCLTDVGFSLGRRVTGIAAGHLWATTSLKRLCRESKAVQTCVNNKLHRFQACSTTHFNILGRTTAEHTTINSKEHSVHPTEIRTSISPSSAVELNKTSALANYATEAGLDAARPMFDRRPPKDRLDPEDAEFVMSIHTAGDFLAFYDPIGHADFYPNGGKSPQPTCQDDELKIYEQRSTVLITTSLRLINACYCDAVICSHFMAPLLFVESIYSADAFLATRCDSWQAYRNKSCMGQEKVIMGLNTPATALTTPDRDSNHDLPVIGSLVYCESDALEFRPYGHLYGARGKFYLDTNLTPPYGRNSNPSIPLNEPSMMMVSDDDEDLENIEVKKHPKPTPTDTKTGSNPDVAGERKPKNIDISSSEAEDFGWQPLVKALLFCSAEDFGWQPLVKALRFCSSEDFGWQPLVKALMFCSYEDFGWQPLVKALMFCSAEDFGWQPLVICLTTAPFLLSVNVDHQSVLFSTSTLSSHSQAAQEKKISKE